MFGAPVFPFRASVQDLGRQARLNEFIRDLSERIPPHKALIHSETYLSKSGTDFVPLKVGDPQPAEAVRDVLLRLELLADVSKETFVALKGYFETGIPLSDWHALNAETYSLGETKDSTLFARALKSEHRRAFWRGFASVLTFGAPMGDWDPPKLARLQFKEKPGVREVFLSAVREDGSLGSPERS